MSGLVFLFGTSFVVAFSGAMMPGPVLTATIAETLKLGFRAGPLIVLGHALLEVVVVAAIVLGGAAWLTRDSVAAALGLAGGIVLVVMGLHMALTARAAEPPARTGAASRRPLHAPVVAGVLTTLSNPYWYLWWATVGLNFLTLALPLGAAGLAAFYLGHIASDLAWYALVAAAVASGRRLAPPSVFRGLLLACGLALVGLGAWFFGSAAGAVPGR